MYNSFLGHDIYVFITETFLVVSLLFLLIYGVICSTSPRYGNPVIARNIVYLSLQSLLFSLFLQINNCIEYELAFNNLLVVDKITNFTKLVILLGGVLCLILAIDYVKQECLNTFEYFILTILAILAILFITSSYDLLSIYLAIELQSLVFYILASIRRSSEFSTESGLKYFILGAFSSGLLLFGISIIYGFTGLTNFEDLSRFFINFSYKALDYTSSGALLGVTFLSASFFFKISAAPFHIWSPDVYEGAPTSVTAFFSVMPKIVIISVFIRLFNKSFHDLFLSWQSLTVFCSLFSLLVGSFGAFVQSRVKRFIAYSSISHIGYILIAFSSANTGGASSLFIYIVIYIIIMISAFSVVLSLRKYKKKDSSCQIRYLTELSILSKTHPILAICITVVLFSIAGIPPLAGFFSKLLVFLSAIESALYGLALAGILLSCVACFYYIRLIKIIYFEKLENWPIYMPIDKSKSLILGVLILLLLIFGIDPELLITPISLGVSTINS
nr:NADH dehydrogenase subunit 2 [Cavernulicola chilensis]